MSSSDTQSTSSKSSIKSSSSTSSTSSNKTYLQRWLDYTANALKPPTDVLSTTPSDTLDSPILRGAEPLSRPPLGPRSAHSSPSLGSASATVNPIPIATAMKRTTSAQGPRKSVSFAVDDNDKPIPTEAMASPPNNTRRHSSGPASPRSLPVQLHQQPHYHASSRLNPHSPHGAPKDFNLYPSPSPSPPTSPMFRSGSAPGSSPLAVDPEHARMMARQKALEDEIADLTRRAAAREAASREALLRRVAEREHSNRRRSDEELAFQDAVARENFHRQFRGSTSITSSSNHGGSPRMKPSRSPRSSNELLGVFPSPLPSPSLSNHHPSPRTPSSPRVPSSPRNRTHASPATLSPHPSPLMETFHSTPPLNEVVRPSRSRSRSTEPNMPRARSPSPADSIKAVVGEREDEVMHDADNHSQTSGRKTKRPSYPQCERCGLFGHALTVCQTPALMMPTVPMRRKREPEKEKDMLKEQPPLKGLRHVKWQNFISTTISR